MNNASKNAYISKGKMDRYREERAKIEKRLAEGGAIDEEQEFQSSDDEKVPKKVEEEKKEPQQMMMQ